MDIQAHIQHPFQALSLAFNELEFAGLSAKDDDDQGFTEKHLAVTAEFRGADDIIRNAKETGMSQVKIDFHSAATMKRIRDLLDNVRDVSLEADQPFRIGWNRATDGRKVAHHDREHHVLCHAPADLLLIARERRALYFHAFDDQHVVF